MGKGRKAGIVNAVLGLDIRKFSTNLQNAKRDLKQSGKSFQQFGKNMTRNLTLPLGVAGGLAVKTFADFEQSMAKVAAISGATGEEFKQLESNALELGRTTRYTSSQVAELQLNLSKLGLTTKEITGSTEAILNLSLATGEDLAESATVAAGVMRAFGLESEDMGRITDVMASSFSSSALDLEKFKVAMSTAAPVARKAGTDIERTTAIIGVLANNSIDASTAGTALRNIFLDLAASGMTWDEAMNSIQQSTNPLKTALQLFGKRGTTVATVIGENADEISRLNKTFNVSQGEAKRMARTMDSTLQGAFLRLKSAIEGVLIDIGKRLSPLVDALTGLLTELASAWNTLPDVIKNTIVVVAGLAAAIGPLAFGFGKLLTMAAPLLGMISTLGLSLAPLAGTIGLVVAGVAALAVAYRRTGKEQSTFAKNLTAEKSGMDAMFAVLKRTKEGTEARAKAIKEVNERYGEYLPNQLSEKSNLNDIETAQRAANKELLRSIFLKSKREDLEAANKKAVDDTRKAMDRLQKVAATATTQSSSFLKTAGKAQTDALFMGMLGAVEEFRSKGSKAVIKEIRMQAAELRLGGLDPFDLHNSVVALLNAENQRLLTIQDINKEYESLSKLLKITPSEVTVVSGGTGGGGTGGGGTGGGSSKVESGLLGPMQSRGIDFGGNTVQPKTRMKLIQEQAAEMRQVVSAEFTNLASDIDNTIAEMNDMFEGFVEGGLSFFSQKLGEALVGGGFKNGELGQGLLEMTGQFLQQLGGLMITTGVSLEAFQKGLASMNPALVIGAGVALVAAGAAVSHLARTGYGNNTTGGASASGFGGNSRSSTIEVDGRLRAGDIVLLQSEHNRRR